MPLIFRDDSVIPSRADSIGRLISFPCARAAGEAVRSAGAEGEKCGAVAAGTADVVAECVAEVVALPVAGCGEWLGSWRIDSR